MFKLSNLILMITEICNMYFFFKYVMGKKQRVAVNWQFFSETLQCVHGLCLLALRSPSFQFQQEISQYRIEYYFCQVLSDLFSSLIDFFKFCSLTLGVFDSRPVSGSRDWCGWSPEAVHPAPELREGLGSWLPPAEHQAHPLLGGGAFAPCAAAAGRGAAHYATGRPWTS